MNDTTTNSSALNWSKDDFSNIETPFEGDHWERKEFAEHLTGYVGRLKIGATLALDAEWGAGKTWFVQHWKQHLINEGHQVAYLDAFANDYIDDPFLVIATEIGNQISKKNKLLGEAVKHNSIAVWHAILPSLPKLIFSALMTFMSAGLLAPVIAEILKATKDGSGDFGEAMAEDFGDRIRAQLEEKVKNYEADKLTVEGFKSQLAEVACHLDKPLVFIIDELDRCKPEFSIRLIERIKHFFDTPNIVFVLSMHKKQLRESIDSYYGFKTQNQYLEKFIDFTFLLKTSYKTESDESIKFHLCTLGLTTEDEVEESSLFIACKFISSLVETSPRQIKSILNKYSLLLTESRVEINQILLVCLFLKESGQEEKINNYNFVDMLVNKIISICNINLDQHLNNYTYKNLEIILNTNLKNHYKKIGIQPILSEFLAIFYSKTVFSNLDNYEKNTLKESISRNLSPIKKTIDQKGHQIWLDYIQRGI
jgi:hypothetical protein